jgi:hypothetical protein
VKTAIIYHQVKPGVDCPDGITAAWVAKRKFPDSDLIGASYGGELPVLGGYDDGGQFSSQYDRVLIVDFSFPREVLDAWGLYFDLVVIDHHKTAMKDLEGFSKAVFDVTESGATLAWKTFFPDESIPAFLEYVKDRDLWNFVLPDSEEIHEAISFNGRKLYQLDFLASLSQDELRNLFAPLGSKLLEPKREKVAAIAATAKPANILGHEAMLVEVGDFESRLVSDVCAAVYKAYPEKAFAVAQSWKEGDRLWALSFRSDKNGNDFDVSEVARSFNGGGHRNAAGGRSKEKLLPEGSGVWALRL